MDLGVWRDVAIVFLAVMWIITLAVVIFLLLKIKSLLDVLPRTVGPLIDSARETASTVHETAVSIKGTASFVNRTTVTPIIRVAAIAAATTRFVKVMAGLRKGEHDG